MHLFATQHPRTPTQDHTFSNGGMLSDSNLTAENRSVFNNGGSGDTRLGGDHNILADDAVVPDMDKVVDLIANKMYNLYF